jgi:hypothetical protein
MYIINVNHMMSNVNRYASVLSPAANQYIISFLQQLFEVEQTLA